MTKVVAFDTETCLISYPDQVNPDGVCISYATLEGTSLHILESRDTARYLSSLLLRGDVHLVGHNVAFDLHVILKAHPGLWEDVWHALKAGRIHDTMLRERLYLLSTSGDVTSAPCSLAALCERRLGVKVDGKEDGWRFKYAELKDIPLDRWPQEACEYALKDAEYTLQVYLNQEATRAPRGPGSMNSETVQVASAFALRGMEIQGMRIDRAAVAELKEHYGREYQSSIDELKEYGLVRPNGTRNLKALEALFEELGVTDTTPSGRVSTSRTTMSKIESDDPRLAAYRRYSDSLKAVTTFIPQMEFDRVHPKFNPIINTLRTSCRSSDYYKHRGGSYGSKVIRRGDPAPSINLQQIPRDARFRRSFIPENGHVFVCADYCNLELVSAAQTYLSIIGFSALRGVLNSGVNLHDVTGTIIYNDHTGADIGTDLFRELIRGGDATAKFCRQSAKFVNLGCPGGQSANTIYRLANDLGIKITLDQAERWREAARGRFPEFCVFFDSVMPQLRSGRMGITVDGEFKMVDRYDIEVHGVWRAKCTYTAAANGLAMQMPSALGKKMAMIRLYEQCTNPSSKSVLRHCRLVLDLHDEMMVSCPEHLALEAEKALNECMLDGMQYVFPNMRIGTESMILRRWNKDAEKEFGHTEFWKMPGDRMRYSDCEIKEQYRNNHGEA